MNKDMNEQESITATVRILVETGQDFQTKLDMNSI